MKLMTNYRLSAMAFLCLITLGGIVGYSQNYAAKSGVVINRPLVNIILSGTVERAGKNIPVGNAGRVNSGETLNWTMVSKNSGTAAALSHDAVGQIPAGTTFVNNSAASEAKAIVNYSIDGGKTFSARPLISAKQADGSVKQVPAPVSMYTQIRFHWDAPLNISDERAASYKVSVN